ncbi:MAG: ABC transporter ATP-binding protein [Hyphomicrobiaceae bacterium]
MSFGKTSILESIDLDVTEGEIVVMLGPNGAGKSTLSRIITGRLKPTRGTVRLNGQDPFLSRNARRSIGLVPQQVALYQRLTSRENLTGIGAIMGTSRKFMKQRVLDLVNRVGLKDRIDDPIKDLSGGMRRRVNIAASLMHDPSLLILDEPTVGLDYKAQLGIANLLRSLRTDGTAILLVTHDLDEAELLADRLAILVRGKIRICGRPDNLIDGIFQDYRAIELERPRDSADMVPTELLTGLGLQPGTGEDHWKGFLRGVDPRFTALHDAFSRNTLKAEAFSVRRAGLASLLHHCVEEAERG